MERDEAESSTPQSSAVSSVVVVDNKKTEIPGEASKDRYLETVKDLDMEDLACRQELERFWDLRTCRTRTSAGITVCISREPGH